MAGTLSGPLAGLSPGHDAIPECRRLARALDRIRAPAVEFCARTDSGGPGSRDGIQDIEIWRVQKSVVAIDAAPGESRNVSSRPGDHASAAAWRGTDSDRPDALLPRALR